VSDTYTAVAKVRLPIIQARIASIKTQTSQYEMMSTKIPGGPKTFVSSTLEELQVLFDELQRIKREVVRFSFVRLNFKFQISTYNSNNIVY